jgi:hypothetical protein
MSSSNLGAYSLPPARIRQSANMHYRRTPRHNQQHHNVTCTAVFRQEEWRRVMRAYSRRSCVLATGPGAYVLAKASNHEGEVGHAH